MLKTATFILIPLCFFLKKIYIPIVDITDELKINKEGYFENVKGIILKDTITDKVIIDGFAKNYNIKNTKDSLNIIESIWSPVDSTFIKLNSYSFKFKNDSYTVYKKFIFNKSIIKPIQEIKAIESVDIRLFEYFLGCLDKTNNTEYYKLLKQEDNFEDLVLPVAIYNYLYNCDVTNTDNIHNNPKLIYKDNSYGYRKFHRN